VPKRTPPYGWRVSTRPTKTLAIGITAQAEQGAGQRHVAQRAVGEFGCVEHAVRVVGEDHAERRLALWGGHIEGRAGERVLDGAVQVGGVSPAACTSLTIRLRVMPRLNDLGRAR
jgi:hypothetical protein